MGVLGPLEVVGEGAAAPTRPKKRAVVAFLALQSEGRVEECRVALDEALLLWRGAPLPDLVDSEVARAVRLRRCGRSRRAS